MIRDAVEALGPVAAVKNAEHLGGPTFMHEADAIVDGICAIAAASERDAVVEECTRAFIPILEIIEREWDFKGAHPHRAALIEHARAAIRALKGAKP